MNEISVTFRKSAVDRNKNVYNTLQQLVLAILLPIGITFYSMGLCRVGPCFKKFTAMIYKQKGIIPHYSSLTFYGKNRPFKTRRGRPR